MPKISPTIRSGIGYDSRLFALHSKPGLYPERQVSHIITARQQISSRKRGEELRNASRDASKAEGTILLTKSPIISSIPDSGTHSKLPPQNRSYLAEIMASFASPSKPESRPKSAVSPRISARQKITPSKKWGIFQPLCVA